MLCYKNVPVEAAAPTPAPAPPVRQASVFSTQQAPHSTT